jgi:hypothetical protein
MDCPRTNCGHSSDKHKTRPGGVTSYCITCAIERDKQWRTQSQICDISPAAIERLHELIDEAGNSLHADANHVA